MPIWSAEIKDLERLYESFKGQFPDLEKELERLIKADDENMILLYSRRCLEVIITDLCECELKRERGTEPLKGIIDKLQKEKKTPAHIIASMHGLNELSTFGTHPKDFDPEQIKPVLNNLDIIIKWFLRHKETSTETKAISTAEVKKELKRIGEIKKNTTIPKKKLIVIISSVFGVILIVITVLILSNKELEKSIAVLPFHNYSGDPAQEFICEGITDEIINHLFKIKSFAKVSSLSSVITYKGTDKLLPVIANELKVNYVLEGTLKKTGDRVKVTAQLIEAKRDKHIWLHEYDRSYKDLSPIPADVALQVASHLDAFLSDFEKQNIKRTPTVKQEAQELIWQATYLYRTKTYKDTKEFYDLVHKAIELDPNYAAANSWMGSLSLTRGTFFGDREILSVVDNAKYYFDKALEFDQNNGGSFLGFAMINEYAKWDYIESEKEILKAIELAPKDPLFTEFYIEFLLKRNRVEDALACISNADISLSLETKSRVTAGVLSGKREESIDSLKSILNANEDFRQSFKGELFIWLQDYESAKQALKNAIIKKDIYIDVPRFQACLALVYYKTNEYHKAQTIINQIIEKTSKQSGGSPQYYTGWYYSGIDKVDSAFFWLEEAYKKHSPEFSWLKVDPVFNCLKNDDHYWDLYDRTGHKAYDDYIAGLEK